MQVQVACCVCIAVSISLHGCGGGTGGGGADNAMTTAAASTTATRMTTTTLTTTTTTVYTCETDLYLNESTIMNTDIKGFALDDQTMAGCPDKTLMMWPHTHTRMKSLRLFASWKSAWGDDAKRKLTWAKLMNVINKNGVTVLFGVDSAYDWGENEKQFQWALQMMKLVKDKRQILALSFGNEMDYKVGIDANKFVSWVKAKVKEMDDAGFNEVKLTMVWSMSAVPNLAHNVMSNGMWNAFKDRWAAWSFNAYSIFGGNPDKQNCQAFTANAISTMYLKNLAIAWRKAVNQATGTNDQPIWIGETGWSSPCVQKQRGVEGFCPEWCSAETLHSYYQMFLEWDGVLGGGLKGVDHMFYFTNRDSVDFNKDTEGFGLVDSCSNPKCKRQSSSVDIRKSEIVV